jgi:transcriptional regulator with XRE-family HTH domain
VAKQRDSFEDEIARHIGARVAELRSLLGLSRKRLADELDVAERTVKAYEIGARRFSAADLLRLCRFFNVPIWRLLPLGEDGRPQFLPRVRMGRVSV